MINRLSVFVASPSDLRPERALVRRVLAELNATPQFRDTTKFVPYLYEDSAPPVTGPEPQSVVDDFMLRSEDADIVVCMFWNRLGTPLAQVDLETGLGFESGTAYEFLKAYRHFRQHGTPIVLLYRCVRKTELDDGERAEAARVDTFFQRFSHDGDLTGIVGEFTHPEDFHWLLRTHLPNAADRQGRMARRARLRAQFVDHGGFIEDRLRRFIGRASELREINARIEERSIRGGYITITGQAGQGKSSVIARLVANAGIDTVAHHFIPINAGPDHQVSLLRDLMARLIDKYDLSDTYLGSDSRPLLRDFFPKVLADVSNRGGREVIFIDGLDQLQEELTGERDISFLPLRLPPGVVFVLGTRPNDALKPLQLLDPHYEYPLPPLSRYDFGAILSHHGVQLDSALIERFYTALNGNALYLDLVVRELAEERHAEADHIIHHLTDNPGGIFSVAIDRLRRQRPLWNEAVKPLLGLLTVAQEPVPDRALGSLLRIDGDTLRSALQLLGGLIARDAEGRCHLYHLKLLEYLRPSEDSSAQPHLLDGDDIQNWHERFVRYCEAGSPTLTDIWLDSKDSVEQFRRVYAREHYAAHLFHAKQWQPLIRVLDRAEFGSAKLRYDPSTRSYGRDLRLGCLALLRGSASEAERARALPTVWRYSLLRCSLTAKARTYSDELFTFLAIMGRSNEALELVDFMPTAERQIAALCRIAQALTYGSGRGAVAPILLRAEQLASQVRDIWSHSRSFHLLLEVVLAGRDWDEAIRIANRIGDARERVEALASVAQALAAAGQPTRMRHVIDGCLELATRIGYQPTLKESFKTIIRDGQLAATQDLVSPQTFGPTTDRSRTIAFAVHVSLGRGCVNDAIVALDRIGDLGLKAAALIELARYSITNHGHATARTMLESVPPLSAQIHDSVKRSDICITVALLMVQAGDRTGALELLRIDSGGLSQNGRAPAFDDLFNRVSALSALAEDYFALGAANTALSTLQEAVRMTRRYAQQEQSHICLKAIAEAAAKLGREDLAGDLLVEAGGAPLAAFGDIDFLLETLMSTGNVGRAIDLLVSDSYLNNLIKKKDWKEAIQFARSEPSKREVYSASKRTGRLSRDTDTPTAPTAPQDQLTLQKRVMRSIAIVRALLEAQETSRARSLVDEILPLARHLVEASVKASAIATCAEALARLNDTPSATYLIQEALDLSTELVLVDRLEVLNTLIPAAMATRQVALGVLMADSLIALVQRTTDPEARLLSLRHAIRALARLKSSARVHEIVQTEWMRTETREEITAMLPLASALSTDASTTIYLAESFDWVDELVAIG